MRQKFEEGDIVECQWSDAQSIDQWMTRSELMDTQHGICRSVGIFVRYDETNLTLALSHDIINDNFSSYIVIPNGMIEALRKIGE